MAEQLVVGPSAAAAGPYRVVFMGTPDFAVPVFSALVEDKRFDVVLAVSQPDRTQGRKRKIIPTPVHRTALDLGIACYQPTVVRNDPTVIEKIKSCRPDFIVTAAYGKILPAELLALAAIAPVNVHASLLPLYRGAAPVHNSIIQGDRQTGVTVMQMVEAMDAGGIYSQVTVPIEPDETAGILMDRLARAGAGLLPDTLAAIAAGRQPVPQDEAKATYVGLLKKEDGRIIWTKTATAIHNLVRGTSPWPGAYSFLSGQTVKIHRTALPQMADLPASVLSLLQPEDQAGAESLVENFRTLPRLAPAAGFSPGQPISCKEGRILVATGGGGIIELLELQLPGGKKLAADQCAHNFKSSDRFTSLAELEDGADR